MSDYIHDDLWIEIFAKLSPKPLLRCTGVCKSWYLLITDPDFVNTHLNCPKPYDLILIRTHTTDNGKGVYALHFDDENLTKCADFDRPFWTGKDKYCVIVGSCNGVLCFTYNKWCNNKIVLWNPSIRSCLRLPKPQISCDFLTGFGFDQKTNDYKVVRIVSDSEGCFPHEAYVYSLSSRTWQDITANMEIQQFISSQASQAYVNGSVYWIVRDTVENKSFGLSFSMEDEMFRTLELPCSFPDVSESFVKPKLRPVAIDGSLAIVESGGERCRIWLMTGNGVCGWSKIVHFEVYGCVGRFWGVRKNGELLFEARNFITRLYSFNPSLFSRSKQNMGRKWFDIGDISIYYPFLREMRAIHIEKYTESLVLLGTQGCEEDNGTIIEEVSSESEEESEVSSDSDSDSDSDDDDDEEEEDGDSDDDNDEADNRVRWEESGSEQAKKISFMAVDKDQSWRGQAMNKM